jgi:phosphopantetheinyl transferase (holo-ACP synthase)
VESVAERAGAFYEKNFTGRERAWVESELGGCTEKAAWLFTFLWTLKECVLKLGIFEKVSLWNMDQLEVICPDDVEKLLSYTAKAALDGDFMVFPVKLKHAGRVIDAHASVTGSKDLVVTVINSLYGVKN